MKIICANKFFYLKGGSEYVFFDTVELLKKFGHEVSFFSMCSPDNFSSPDEPYFVSSVDFEKKSKRHALKGALRLLYSWESRRQIDRLLEDRSFDVAHLHNIYHQISPSILHSLKKKKVPIVMTLHDSKLVCASYYLMRQGKICHACAGGRYYQCVLGSCVKHSRMKSILAALEMYLHHTLLHVYDLVDVFISPSMFLKNTLKSMGFKKNIVCLPNFVDTSLFRPQYSSLERNIVYFGRITQIKGVATLIDAVKNIKDITLTIIGDGDLKDSLEASVDKVSAGKFRFLGYKTGEALYDEIRKAVCVVVPSECYENNPRAIIEAFALGKPVIGSRIGGIPELIKDGETGFLSEAGNAADLTEKISMLLSDHKAAQKMGIAARRFVEDTLNAQIHYHKLMEIYRSLVG